MITQLTCALALALGPQQTPADFDYLPGTWAMIKDGFSFTIEIEPIMQGTALRSTMTLDENNRQIATSIYAFDAGTGSWTRTQFSNTGQRSTFVGGAKPDALVSGASARARALSAGLRASLRGRVRDGLAVARRCAE